MRAYVVLGSIGLVLRFYCVSAIGQPLSRDESTSRRALVVANTRYQKISAPPVDSGGPKAVEAVLRDAGFDVVLRENLDFRSLIDTFDRFQETIKKGDTSFFYYSGYLIQDVDDNYLLPIDFDPRSKSVDDRSALLFTRIERGLSAKEAFLSMVVLDASWGAPELSGHAAMAAPIPSRRSWIFSSASPNQNTSQTYQNMGLFTNSFVKAVPQPGLDLTDLVSKVTRDVEAASQGTQHPESWSTDPPRFYFHVPVPIGMERMNGNDRLKYVYIPAGKFWMGCAPASEAQCKPEEKPRHLVEITKGYWLGQTEVTNLAYERYAAANKIPFKPKKHITDAGKEGDIPVVDVSWEKAQKYCQWTAKGGRLPSEAEWERAARGGIDDEVYPFKDLATSRDKANFEGTSGNDRFVDIAPVQQFDPNPYALYDMAGNVWEWTLDWFSATYYSESAKESPIRDPEGPSSPDKGRKHTMRGGSWHSDPAVHLRISYRESGGEGGNLVGFRCLLPDTPAVTAGFRN